jgi:serine/threonine protein kinase
MHADPVRRPSDRMLSSPAMSSLAGASAPPSQPNSQSLPTSGDPCPSLADHPEYQILRELGRGGMGVVYLAENQLMGRKEVLKVVSVELINRRGVMERFLGEIRNAARLDHPNVVIAYAAIRLGESLGLAMEYVDGLDLARLVKARGPLPVANACNYVYQAALGLQHAHERGMVHRDIKPGNLMLTSQGSRALVKVLDFGLAKVSSEVPANRGLTHDGQMLGTPDFIAPEQIRDAKRADTRADIYSLGCTLYYVLLGSPPFAGTSLYDILQAHHSMDATPLNLARPEVPVEVAAIAAKMMAKEPERRFHVPKEVAEALKPFFKAGSAASQASDRSASQARGPATRVELSRGAFAPTQVKAELPAAPASPAGPTEPRQPKEPIWESLITVDQDELPTKAVSVDRSQRWREWRAWATRICTRKHNSSRARLAAASTILLVLSIGLAMMRAIFDERPKNPTAPAFVAHSVEHNQPLSRSSQPLGIANSPDNQPQDGPTLIEPSKENFRHPDEVNGVRSIEATFSTPLTFVNRSEQTVKVYWLDYQGRRVLYATLQAGETATQQTFLTHPWVITDASDRAWDVYYPTREPRTVIIAGPKQR